MTRKQTILALVAVAVVAAWGCGQKPTGQTGSLAPSQARSLEARVSKLEKELKTAQAQAADWRERYAKEQTRAQAAEKERDDLRAGLRAKAAERDALQTRLDGIQKLLREALGQMETAAVPAGSLPAVELPKPNGL